MGADGTGELTLSDIFSTGLANWRKLVALPLAAGVLSLGVTYLIAPTFTAKATLVPPQQQQGGASALLASLGALSGMAGGALGVKTPGDQYISLMQSANVEDRIVDRFKLMQVYDAKYRVQARGELERNSRISLGKKDGLIYIEVDAKDPAMAAEIANQYIAELRRLTSELALTEAQQRRQFFEHELKNTRDRLAQAQQQLQSSGFNASALRTEPKEAAEAYARVKAQVTAAEVRVQTLRRSLTDSSPELQQQMTMLGALREQLSRLEVATDSRGDADYVSRYREFKYQEVLFELFSKQYELARLDESREGAPIQVVDPATPPEVKSKPRRAFTAIVTSIVAFVALLAYCVVRRPKARST
jgi:uncharacterized protein involved in exopolysaccharide biosynthesis